MMDGCRTQPLGFPVLSEQEVTEHFQRAEILRLASSSGTRFSFSAWIIIPKQDLALLLVDRQRSCGVKLGGAKAPVSVLRGEVPSKKERQVS